METTPPVQTAVATAELNVGPPILPEKGESPVDRKPQPLSRNPDKRTKQLAAISENPTPTQIGLLADKFRADNSDPTADPEEMARNAFENIKTLTQDRQQAEMAVKQARSDALSAPKAEFKGRVEALREAEKRRTDIASTLKTLGSDFQDVGIQVDPSQRDLTLGEKMGQKAISTREGVKAGTTYAKETVKGAVGYVVSGAREVGGRVAAGAQRVSEGVVAGATLAAERGRAVIEVGRQGLRGLLGASVNTLNRAQETGQAGFSAVRTKAEATTNRATGGISKLAEMWRSAKERGSQKVGSVWEAASVWVNQRREDIARQTSSAYESLESQLTRGRNTAAERIGRFNQGMHAAGELAKGRWDKTSDAARNFASEQTQRVDNLRRQITDRVRGEVSMAVAKGRIFLEPAWQAVQRDREVIKENKSVMAEKLGILVEGVSDLAAPIIDRILDEGRDLRDSTVGLGARGIEGVKVFGRNIARRSTEAVSPAWDFMVERWENLRLRGNESRGRLNTFLEGVSGKAGNRFRMLQESVAERANRASSFISGVKTEGGRVMHNGVVASREVAEWFVQTGTTAREYLEKGRERVGQGLNMLQRYWEVYAVGKWKESGISDIDIKRRMKLLRATGSASLDRAAQVGGRVATMGAAAGMEGAMMLGALARDRRAQIALPLLALGLALAANPEITNGLQDMLSNIDLSGLHMPDFGGLHMPDLSSHAAALPDHSAVTSVDLGNLPLDSVVSGPPAPLDIPAGVSLPTPMPDVVSPSVLSPDVVASTVVTPDIAAALPNLDMLSQGQSLEAQARQLAGGVNENYYRILQTGVEQFRDNFLTTAQSVIENASKYTPQEVNSAQEQLQALAKLNQDPTLVQGSQGWYDTVMKATHFWRPI